MHRFEKIKEARNFTYEELQKWKRNKSRNPRTDRVISEGGQVYETLQALVEQEELLTRGAEMEESRSEVIKELFDEQSETERSDTSTCKLFKPCKRALDYVTDFGCRGQRCMAKGCQWRGYLGLNLVKLPSCLHKAISFFFPLVSGRCCCFCVGHFLMFVSIIMDAYSSAFVPRDVKEILKIQKTVDKINTSSDVDKTVTSILNKEFSAQIDKLTGKAQNVLLKNITKAIATKSDDSFPSYVEELQTLIAKNSSWSPNLANNSTSCRLRSRNVTASYEQY